MRKIISVIILIFFILSSFKDLGYAQVDHELFLPKPGQLVHISPRFSPSILQGIVIHPNDPFKFDFIINHGETPLTAVQKKEEYARLIKYFLASLAIPDEQQWVNLSPYEKDRMINDDFGKTLMGRDLLAQDYLLKQITASLIYPNDDLGRKFWSKVYAKAKERFGTASIPVNTFNKVWIMPDEASIYEKGNTAYVLKNHLKVMLDEDYTAIERNKEAGDASAQQSSQGAGPAHLVSQIVREIVLPELERDVNEGNNFVLLRQVYSGMILATWFKRSLKQSLLGQVYVNKAKTKGVDQQGQANEAIYKQYLEAYKKGVFNLISNDVDGSPVPRKYSSGGTISYAMAASLGGKFEVKQGIDATEKAVLAAGTTQADLAQVIVNGTTDAAMNAIVARNYAGQKMVLSNDGNLFGAIGALVEQQVKAGVAVEFPGNIYSDSKNRGIYEVQVNPARDPTQRAKRRPGAGSDFLDPENMPEEEMGFVVPGYSQYDVFPNTGPYAKKHVVIVGRKNGAGHVPFQALDTKEKIRIGFDFLKMVDVPDYNTGFNAMGAGNSSPHFHWHGFQATWPVDRLDIDSYRYSNGIKIGFVKDYPGQVIALEGNNIGILVDAVYGILGEINQTLHKSYNVKIRMDEKGIFKVLIFVRTKEIPSQFLIEQKFGIAEVSGVMNTWNFDPETGEGLLNSYYGGVNRPGGVKITGRTIAESIETVLFQDRKILESILDRTLGDEAMKTEVRLIEDGPRDNWLVTGPVPAHIVTSNQAKDKDGIIIAMPRRHSQPLFYIPVFSDNNETIKWTPEDVVSVSEADDQGIVFSLRTGSHRSPVRLDLDKLLLNHTFNLRMSLYYGVHVPDDEKELRQAMDALPEDQKEELQDLVGGSVDELILPQINYSRDEGGSFVIDIKKKTFDGKNNYHLRIAIPHNFKVRQEGESIVIMPDGNRPVEFQVKASADFELLTPLKMEDIFNQEAMDFMRQDSEFARTALNFATLFYKEKLLAGSWVYFAYFGRDTLVAARLMWSALTDKAKQMIIQGVLDKTNHEGIVAVNDEVSGEMFLQLEVAQKYKELKAKGENPDLIQMFVDALKANHRRAVLSYDVLDNSFLLQGVVRRFFDDMMDKNQLEAFIEGVNDRGEKNLETIFRAWEHVLTLSAPYAKNPTADNLIAMVDGAGVANWRDSPYGIAYGRHAADINITLAPSSIADIHLMVKRLKGIGVDVLELSRKNGFKTLAAYAENEGEGFVEAAKAWSTSIDHFTTRLSADELRKRLAHRLETSLMPENRKQAMLAMNIGQNEQVTVRAFLDGKTPDWLSQGFSFTDIAYGKAIVHNDETYALLDQDLESNHLNRILDNLFAPYPIGLWHDDLGLFIANAFFMRGEDDVFNKFDDPAGYHSHHVIWSKPMRELKLGLIRQMRHAMRKGRHQDYQRLEGSLARVMAVEQKIGILGQSEIWTWEADGQASIRPVAYNQNTRDEQPASPMGVWGLADGKGQPPGNPQLWSNSAAAFELYLLRKYRIREDEPVEIYDNLNGFTVDEAWGQIDALNQRIQSVFYHVNDRFHLIKDTLSGAMYERKFFIAVNNATHAIEGYVIFQIGDATTANVLYLAVEPGHEKQHIGTQLMKKVLEYSHQQGISRIDLKTPAGPNPAITFYTELPKFIEGLEIVSKTEAGGYVFFSYAYHPSSDAAMLNGWANKRFSVLRMIARVRKNRRRDDQTAREIRLNIKSSHRAAYYMILEALGLSDAYAHQIKFDQLYFLWHQSWNIGDDIMENFGSRLMPEDLGDMLTQAAERQIFPKISAAILKKRGITDDELVKMPASNVLDDDLRSRPQIVEDSERQSEEIIRSMPITEEAKDKIRRMLLETSLLVYASYHYEKVIGIDADKDLVKEYLHKKSSILITAFLFGLRDVFNSNPYFDKNQELLTRIAYFIQVIDDLHDLGDDAKVQPNLFWAYARQYPEEFQKIQGRLERGIGSFNSIKGLSQLRKIAPRTTHDMITAIMQEWFKLFKTKPSMALLMAVNHIKKMAGGVNKQEGADAAMHIKGGIDMNSNNLNLIIKRDTQGFILPADQQDLAQLSQIQGLTPEVLSVVPFDQTPLSRELLSP